MIIVFKTIETHWWLSILCLHDILGLQHSLQIYKNTFGFLQFLVINLSIVSMVSSLPCPNLHVNSKTAHSNVFPSSPDVHAGNFGHINL